MNYLALLRVLGYKQQLSAWLTWAWKELIRITGRKAGKPGRGKQTRKGKLARTTV